MSPLSSNGYSGPIYRPADASIAIENGYPGPTSNRDERFSSRLEADLKQLGLIYDLNPTDRFAPPPLEVVSQPWQSANDSTKVRVEYFPATFQVGQKARIHVFFSFNTPFGKLEPTRSFDCAVLDVRLVSSDGRFRSQTRLGAFTFEQLAQQPLVVAHFDPWQGEEGSLRPMTPGDAEVALSVLLQKRIQTGFSTVSRLDFPEASVPFQGP